MKEIKKWLQAYKPNLTWLAILVLPFSPNYKLEGYSLGSAGGAVMNSGSYEMVGSAGELSNSNLSGGSYDLGAGLAFIRQANVPPAPALTNPANYYNKLHIVINEGDNPSDTKYAIAISSDDFATTQYVKNDHTIGSTLSIGDASQGGKVAYILQVGDSGYDANIQKGLIASTANIVVDSPWGCSGTTISGADGTVIGTGEQNTADILAGCADRPIAASEAVGYTGGGYTDWYLPSKDELNQLYTNREAIGGFDANYYWSSSEYSANNAWSQAFNNGLQGHSLYKFNAVYVRAIRAFIAPLTADYQTYSEWGGASGIDIIGLSPGTTYSVKVKAMQGEFTETGWGPKASADTVSQTLTFDIDVSAIDEETGAPYSINLGELTPGNVANSNEKIWIDLETNANNGASVYVYGQYAGLYSLTVGSTISAVSGNLATLSKGFGVQGVGATQVSGGPITIDSIYNLSGDIVGKTDTVVRQIFKTGSPVTTGRARFMIKAKTDISIATASDYSETLTVVAAAHY